jgi:hypothetical protein
MPGLTGFVVRTPRPSVLARLVLVAAIAGLAAAAAPAAALAAGQAQAAQAAQTSPAATPRWRVQHPVVPAGALTSALNGVSCASARACVVVGSYESNTDSFPALSQTWNGSKWTVRGVADAVSGFLSSVSCPAAGACIAVGDNVSAGKIRPLAERWDGNSWKVLATPTPAGTVRSFLTSVSCPTIKACLAVGFEVRSSGAELSLTERWNGTTWRLLASPSPSPKNSALNSVSCPSASTCVAVGATTSSVFGAKWNGSTWKVVKTPIPRGGSNGVLSSVSCPAAGACTAVGDYFSGSRLVPLAERWNGKGWTPQHPVSPSGKQNGELTSVSCAGPGSCSAVGTADGTGGGSKTLVFAEHWNGRAWSAAKPQAVPGAIGSALSGVSCSSSVACTAIGFATPVSGNQQLLAERYS